MSGRRVAIALATACTLIGAPGAQAAITVASSHGSVTPKFNSSLEKDLASGQLSIGDPGPDAPPDLTVDPGATVTIAVSDAHTSFQASLGATPLTLAPTAPGTYSATLPAGAQMPVSLNLTLRHDTDQHELRVSWQVNLVAPPTPPTPPQVPTDTRAPAVDQPPSVTQLKLKGRRLTATVACPSDCAGYLTVRTKSIRIARFSVTRGGTYTATVSASALRHLKRHKQKQLRTLLTTRGRAPIAAAVRF